MCVSMFACEHSSFVSECVHMFMYVNNYCVFVCVAVVGASFTHLHTFSNLADAFIQSDVQRRKQSSYEQ